MNPKQILKNVHCVGLEAKNHIFIYYADHDPVLRLNAAHSQGDRLADRQSLSQAQFIFPQFSSILFFF